MPVGVCVVEQKENCPIFFVLGRLHNSTQGCVCVHLHSMI